MVTDASTPSATPTVTGASTVTPTAPSDTEEVSLGTSRSANGVPLSKMTFGGAAVWVVLQATPITANIAIATDSNDRRLRKGVINCPLPTLRLFGSPPTLNSFEHFSRSGRLTAPTWAGLS